jgi:mono/diheme cytochrome c family protein
MAVVVSAAFLLVAVAQEEGEPITLDSGAYTVEQAERGAEAYVAHCSVCHGIELAGGAGPALVGEGFLGLWEGSSLDRLYKYTRSNMPLERGGTLSNEMYLDILAHMLSVNGFPAGDFALEDDTNLLSVIEIISEPSTP